MSSNSKKIDIIERKLVKYNVRKDKYVKIKKNGNEREKENADKRLKEVNIRIRQNKQEIKLRKEMGKNGRLLAEDKFDIKNINKEQITLYKKLINFNDENSNTK